MRYRLARSLPIRQTVGGPSREAQPSRHDPAAAADPTVLADRHAPRRRTETARLRWWRWWRWCVVVAAALAYAYLAVYLGPKVQSGASGLTPFDLRWAGYSTQDARQFLEALQPEAAEIYRGPARLVDTIVPLLLAIVFCMPLRGRRPQCALPALCYAVLDLAENAAVEQLLVSGPLVDDGAVALASALTQSKFLAAAVALGMALWSLYAAWRRRDQGGT